MSERDSRRAARLWTKGWRNGKRTVKTSRHSTNATAGPMASEPRQHFHRGRGRGNRRQMGLLVLGVLPALAAELLEAPRADQRQPDPVEAARVPLAGVLDVGRLQLGLDV